MPQVLVALPPVAIISARNDLVDRTPSGRVSPYHSTMYVLSPVAPGKRPAQRPINYARMHEEISQQQVCPHARTDRADANAAGALHSREQAEERANQVGHAREATQPVRSKMLRGTMMACIVCRGRHLTSPEPRDEDARNHAMLTQMHVRYVVLAGHCLGTGLY